MSAPSVSPELPTRTWRMLLALVRRLPQAGLSRAMGRLADTPLPRGVRPAVLRAFARAFHIDVSEAELPLGEYGSVNAFFVRRLKSGIRRIPHDPRVLASPVDGSLGQFGRIRDGELIQAKGRRYTAAALLDDAAEAERFRNGWFLTLYLSPRDYHRIHAPCDGSIGSARHVPGTLFPVNAAAVMHVEQLFARNERLLCYIDGPLGRVAVVAVGAYNVARISATFDPGWTRGDAHSVTNARGQAPQTRQYEDPIPVRQGEEIMIFHLGSTVVLLLEESAPLPRESLAAGARVRLGEVLAERVA